METATLKDAYEISVWEDELIPQSINENGEKVQEYFQEKKIAVIGGNDVTSRFSAHTPTLTKNINGTITLTFQLFYYCFDEDEGIDSDSKQYFKEIIFKIITEIMNFTTSVGKFSCFNKTVQIHSERKNPKKVKATGKIKQKI